MSYTTCRFKFCRDVKYGHKYGWMNVIAPSIHPSIHTSFHPFIHPSIHPSILWPYMVIHIFPFMYPFIYSVPLCKFFFANVKRFLMQSSVFPEKMSPADRNKVIVSAFFNQEKTVRDGWNSYSCKHCDTHLTNKASNGLSNVVKHVNTVHAGVFQQMVYKYIYYMITKLNLDFWRTK